ncbi:G-type lectin S-receptor-like serine/threonine-protein kinase RKS1 [Corylus avellana]|uniref:G-type lectin S-receptor-like serine/threonine-protein kinase RKS1 n=1 Tax=Corylus avellana TaxID=13451 RepID=UPI00286C3FB1|nr:G-type lectin S-receptor-like serine/threonine-protein kinase RKS1 [Corylus avellana]
MDAEKLFKSLILFILFFFPFCTSIDTLKPNQSIKGGQYLMSKEKNFALGFFNPGNSSYWYLGIWYFKVTVKTVVWVANRNNPINGSSGVLSIDQYGNLVIRNGSNHLLWTTNVSVQGTTSTVAQLQDSGNLVLVQDNNMIWQSFDYPTDTLLKGMKVGLNWRTGMHWFLTSWKSQDDPGAGDYVYRLDPARSPEFFLYKGSTPLWRTGPWPWPSSAAETTSYDFKINFVYNQDEISYSYLFDDPSVLITRLVVDSSGLFRQLMWIDGYHQWKELWSAPRYQCDKYGHCGKNSICSAVDDFSDRFECSCLPGCEPKSSRDWHLRNGSEGCVRKQLGLSMCRNGEGFVNVGPVKTPDSPDAAQLDRSMSGAECQTGCLRNCSCTAFMSLNVDGKGIGCWTWYGDLVDIEGGYTKGGFDLIVRVNASELAKYKKNSKGFLAKNRKLVIAVLSVSVLWFLGSLLACIWLLRRRKTKGSKRQVSLFDDATNGSQSFLQDSTKLDETRRKPNVQFFDLSTIIAATDNFSPSKRLGQGGFGPVYKGQLANGQEIAVKTLSRSSKQGTEEFKNEVKLIAKLQHRNLVRLFGCCIHKEEKMLMYEYMPNKSLDLFIFDEIRRKLLDWRKRFDIISGIARGVLYLHQDSGLKIIHRDLKASNVLLDSVMNPKISDFGLARMFGDDQEEASTRKVVGTYGYMSPEYAMEGLYSMKSDVFSYGVLTLEIISGKRNNYYHVESPSLNLIGYVWDLWMDGKAMDVVDPSLGKEYPTHEVLRCIQIGLLCVQEQATDRPTMLETVFMLGNETIVPSPNKPAFINRTINSDMDSSRSKGPPASINKLTITMPEGR